MGEKYGHLFLNDPAPAGLDPLETMNYWLNERQMQGRSPNQWLDWVHSTYNFDTLPSSSPAGADLVASTLTLNALLGLTVSPLEVLAMNEQAAALDPTVRAAFANLVATVATAYAAQIPLAEDILTQMPTAFDPHVQVVSHTQREEIASRAADILQALNLFQLQTGPTLGPQPTVGACPSPPLFSDPEGAVVLGSTCDDTYTQAGTLKDPVLLVDPGGNDVYLNSAGGANPVGLLTPGSSNTLVLSVLFDAQGNDQYVYNGIPSAVQGAGAIGGIGILADATGDDQYRATMTRLNTISTLTNVQYYFDGGGQGFGFGGYGLLLDGIGDDVYLFNVASSQGRAIWAFAQGFGALGGLGINSDGAGTDDWLSNGLGITGCVGACFQGLYTQGVGFYSGVGIMTDTGLGNDIYHSYDTSGSVDYYAQGFGAFAGLGIMADDGGNDDYIAIERATSANPLINPLLNCAYGTASLGGYGVMIEGGGDDSYFGDTISSRRAHTMNEGFGGIGAGVGLFYDLGGVDSHVMQAHGLQGNELSGRGVVQANQIFENIGLGEGGNIIGNYLDIGGVDTYEGPGQDASSGNGVAAVWALGADINTV